MNSDFQYGGFWRRFGAMWLDVLILSPLILLTLWGSSSHRLFQAFYLLPGLAIGAFYSIYLVKRFGGTPGKLILRLRIVKLDGTPIGYREAILRELPGYVFSTLLSLGTVIASLKIGDAEYLSLDWRARAARLDDLAPGFQSPVQIAQTAWIWGEFLVLLTNERRRAIHDFIAGTVVVVAKTPIQAAQTTTGRFAPDRV